MSLRNKQRYSLSLLTWFSMSLCWNQCRSSSTSCSCIVLIPKCIAWSANGQVCHLALLPGWWLGEKNNMDPCFWSQFLPYVVVASSVCNLLASWELISLSMVNVRNYISVALLKFFCQPDFSAYPVYNIVFIRIIMVFSLIGCYIHSCCYLFVIASMIVRCLCWDSAHSWISQKRWGHRLSWSARPRFFRPC